MCNIDSDVITGLRNFQIRTVKHVIDKIENNGSRKFLVADEVGLGKTKIAKAMVKYFLKKTEKPLTALYLCANQQLAWQNLKTFHFCEKKKAKEEETIRSDIRLSLFAWKKLTTGIKESKKINLFALTPGTSFEIACGSGNMEERALITVLLDEDRKNSDFQTAIKKYSSAMYKNKNWDKKLEFLYKNFPEKKKDLQQMILKESKSWRTLIDFYRAKCPDNFRGIEIELKSADDYLKGMQACFIVYGNAEENDRKQWRKEKNYPGAPLSFMRQILAKAGIEEVNPDLIIMDEFQKYEDLLFPQEKDSEESLFSFLINECEKKKPYFLLLSATPYSTFAENKDLHDGTTAHSGFIKLLKWLAKRDDNVKFEELRSNYFNAMNNGSKEEKESTRQEFQNAVLNYMCRTERRNLKKNKDEKDFPESLWNGADVSVFSAAAEEIKCCQKAHEKCKQDIWNYQWNQLLDLTKYATKPLSFMHDYKLQKNFAKIKKNIPELFYKNNKEALKECKDSRISKLKEILGKLFEKNLLWIPPSNPRRPLEGDFKGAEGLSKVLIFSSWRFIPRMISVVLSSQFSGNFPSENLPENIADQNTTLSEGQSQWHPAQALKAAICRYFLSARKDQIDQFVNEYISAFCLRIFRRDKLTKEMIAYCHDGCLEDVFDEYIYMIRKQLDDNADISDLWGYLSTQDLRLSTYLKIDTVQGNGIFTEKYISDCFGEKDSSTDEDDQQKNAGGSSMNLQRAFNSPFPPFVLSTTSIGQEGLDFHWYCRKIIHWNIPQNPIEMEQRNGRIDRFHSLSVRQSIIAKLNEMEIVTKEKDWSAVFAEASEKLAADENGLSPDWYIENPEYPIEQYAYYLPFSKDKDDLDLVCYQSGYYRFILGQPNFQEFRSLCEKVSEGENYLSFQPPEKQNGKTEISIPQINPD